MHTSVLDSLGSRITSGVLKEGHVLTLEGIADEYAVSRPVAREAVRVLQSMSMVAARRRVGITVLPRTGWHVFDPLLIRWRLTSGDRAQQLVSLSELRRGFEPMAARLAAERASAEQCAVLATSVSDMYVHAKRGDLEAFLEADTIFHRTIVEATDNEMMIALGVVIAEVLAGRTRLNLMPEKPKPEALEWHDLVARAIRSGEADRAEQVMREIIDEAVGAMREETQAAEEARATEETLGQ